MKPFISKLIYVAKRNWYGFALIFFLSTLPDLYSINSRLPDASQWQHASGILTFERTRRNDLLVKVAGKTFTCKGSFCLTSADAARLNGRTAQVSWFRQPIYPFMSNNRFIEVIVDGVIVIPEARTRAAIAHEARIIPDESDWIFIGVVLLVFLVMAIVLAAVAFALFMLMKLFTLTGTKQPKPGDRPVGGPD